MAFKKGTDKPDGSGRKKGSTNKVTKDVKEIISKIVEERIAELNNDLDNMTPSMKWIILEKIMKFAYPTLSSQKIDADVKHDGNIEVRINYINPLGKDKK